MQARDGLGFLAHYFQQTTYGSFLRFARVKNIVVSM